MADVKPSIMITHNGPYVVTGVTEMTNSKGEHIAVKDGMELCRCGHSKTKPFCDSSHRKCGFKDEKN